MLIFLSAIAAVAVLALFAVLDSLKEIRAELIRTRESAEQRHGETREWLQFIQASIHDVEMRIPEPDHPPGWSEEE